MNDVEIKRSLEKYLEDNPDYLSDFYSHSMVEGGFEEMS